MYVNLIKEKQNQSKEKKSLLKEMKKIFKVPLAMKNLANLA